MKKITLIIGTAFIIMFGIHAMYQTILPVVVLDPALSKNLEAISRDAPAQGIPLFKTVTVIYPSRNSQDSQRKWRSVIPVSLERVGKWVK